jgi:hypothetical protein
MNDSLTIPGVPISNGHLHKIMAESARIKRFDFITPATINKVQKMLVGKGCSLHHVIYEKLLEPISAKVIKIELGRV